MEYRGAEQMKDRESRHPRRHPHRLPREAYQQVNQPVFFSMCTGRRRPFLTVPPNAELVVQAVDPNARINKSFVIAYCIMPDHLHLLACVTEEGGDVLSFVEGLKKTTGHSLRRSGVSPPIWQRSLWDRHARKRHDLSRQIAYVLANPVRWGLCEQPEEWPYSEFRGYPWE